MLKYVKRSFLVSTSLVLLFGSVIFALPINEVSAVSGDSWRPGNIIDDAVFFNKNGMSVTEIQSFLNTMNPACDTWGTEKSELGGGTRAQYGASRGYPAPFVCLKNYMENPNTKENNLLTASGVNGGIGAAQIIKNASDTYNINPKVLLVTIQKESSMVTDSWPLRVQYDAIMGFDCPDSGPGNSANCNSAYAGFYNQINLAARQFKIYADSPQNYRYKSGQTVNIQFNPNYSCGSTPVFIENQATAGLYNYTPYQPNQAALNNLYGHGDGCSAYGNRNFWRMFNEWFGRTTYLYGSVASKNTLYASLPCTVPQFDNNFVGRLYNPDTQDYLYTTLRSESCGAIKLGYIWDDVVFKNEPSTNLESTPVYRLRVGSLHVYTASLSERNQLINNGHIDEGIAFNGLKSHSTESLPVYQLGLLMSSNYSSFMTSAGDEGTYFVTDLGYTSRGIGFYTTKLNSNDKTTLYRLRNNNDRFYTTSQPEVQSAITNYKYSSEGTALNVQERPGEYSKPVYRLNGPGGRLYTSSRDERDSAVINYGYKSEGVGFYSYTKNLFNTSPILRSTNYTNKTRLYTPSIAEHYDSQTYYGYKVEGVSWYGLK